MIALLGIAALIAIAVAFSERRRDIRWRIVLSAFALQAGIAVLALYVPFGEAALEAMARGVLRVVGYAEAGIDFLFGPLASEQKIGFVVALKVLPVIIFVSSLIAVLYHLRVMPLLVIVIGGGLRRIIGTSQVESLCAAANIFVGMVEAPLVIRPYLANLSRAQLFAVMGVGLSSVSGAILISYASLGIDLEYLLAAAFMAAPGGLMMSKLLVPDRREETAEDVQDLQVDAFDPEHRPANVIEAAADGAMQGLKIAAAVGAMLIAFVALLALLNDLMAGITGLMGFDGVTLEYLLGLIFSPLMILLGIPPEEALAVGNLVGQKTILNEFIAYVQLAQIQGTLSDRSVAIATFALCGFANLSALAIIFGGLGALVPERKHEIARLGLKAVLAGTLSNLTSAALAGLLLSL